MMFELQCLVLSFARFTGSKVNSPLRPGVPLRFTQALCWRPLRGLRSMKIASGTLKQTRN
jgi:hypothetical protein